jgi:hypothetical protein
VEPGIDRGFTIYPSFGRSWIFAIGAFLLTVPGVMILLTENGPGLTDDILSWGLIAFGVGGGLYLLIRRRRPVFSADASGLTYVPYDDPVARIRYGREIRIPWSTISSIAERLVGSPAVVPVVVIGTVDGRRIELPRMMLGLSFGELRDRLQEAAGEVPLPFEP